MEVREGYIKTDIGFVPEDWEVKTFKDICWVNQGLQIPIEKRLKIPNHKSKIYITIQFLNDGKEIEYIDDYSNSVCCTKEDILMTRTGNTGIVISNVEGVFHNNFFKINFYKQQIVREFLLYYLEDNKTQKIILEKAGTSTIPDLNHNDFYSIKIPIPPTKEEQKAIAEVLSDTDNLIQALEKRIAKKRQIKQGAMQKLLTPKDDWEVKKLGEIFTITRGLVLSIDNLYGDIIGDYKYPVYSSQTINKGLTGYYTDYLFENSITWTTDGANAGDVKFRKGKFYCTNVCGVLKSDKGYANLCVAEAFNSISKRYVSYVGNPKLMNNVVANIEIALPPIEEQVLIADILSDMVSEIETLEKKLEKYKQLKQGLMQELLTGKTRLIVNGEL